MSLPSRATTVYVGDTDTTIVWEHVIKRLKIEHKHYNIEVDGNRVKLQVQKQAPAPTTLTLTSERGEQEEIKLVYDPTQAEDLYDLRLPEKSDRVDINYLHLMCAQENAYIKAQQGTITTIMLASGHLYVQVLLDTKETLADVEASTDTNNSYSIETTYQHLPLEQGNGLIIKLTPQDIEKSLTILLLDDKGKEISKFNFTPSEYV